jgi:hypothetical protein
LRKDINAKQEIMVPAIVRIIGYAMCPITLVVTCAVCSYLLKRQRDALFPKDTEQKIGTTLRPYAWVYARSHKSKPTPTHGRQSRNTTQVVYFGSFLRRRNEGPKVASDSPTVVITPLNPKQPLPSLKSLLLGAPASIKGALRHKLDSLLWHKITKHGTVTTRLKHGNTTSALATELCDLYIKSPAGVDGLSIKQTIQKKAQNAHGHSIMCWYSKHSRGEGHRTNARTYANFELSISGDIRYCLETVISRKRFADIFTIQLSPALHLTNREIMRVQQWLAQIARDAWEAFISECTKCLAFRSAEDLKSICTYVTNKKEPMWERLQTFLIVVDQQLSNRTYWQNTLDQQLSEYMDKLLLEPPSKHAS